MDKYERSYWKRGLRDRMSRELDRLMDQGTEKLQTFNFGENDHLYDLSTHSFLTNHAWELMFPLAEDKWPDKFSELALDERLSWPQGTLFNYIMAVICPPSIHHSNLYFGYAVFEYRIEKVAFFAVSSKVDYQPRLQGMVIDPMVSQREEKPWFYVGCSVDRNDLYDHIISRDNPLDVYVGRKSKEEHARDLYDAYIDAYGSQLGFNPTRFPRKILEFAQREGLHYPVQEV